MGKKLKHVLFVCLLFLFVFPQKAHAYLDPGTGSYLLQVAGAAIFGALFFVKSWWGGLKHFISSILRKDGKASEKSSHKDK